jgi:hypothetical protein
MTSLKYQLKIIILKMCGRPQIVGREGKGEEF